MLKIERIEIMKARRFISMGTILISVLLITCVYAVEGDKTGEINTGQDITKPLSRFDFRWDAQQIDGDSTAYTTTFRFDMPIPLGEEGEDGIFYYRMDLPLVYSDAPGRDNANGDYEFGTGDFLTQFVYVPPPHMSENLPWDDFGFGVQLIWPTASKDIMGYEQYMIKPVFGAKLNLSEKFGKGAFFLPIFGYLTDYANYSGGKSRDNVGELSIQPSLYIPIPKDSGLPFDFINFWANNDIRINVEDGQTKRSGDIFIPFDVMFGKMLNRNTVASIDFATPLYKSDGYDLYDWIIQFRIGFFF